MVPRIRIRIHTKMSCVCEQFIHSQVLRSTYFLQQNSQIGWVYINRSQTPECGNVAGQFLFWEYLRFFAIFSIGSLQCRDFVIFKSFNLHGPSSHLRHVVMSTVGSPRQIFLLFFMQERKAAERTKREEEKSAVSSSAAAGQSVCPDPKVDIVTQVTWQRHCPLASGSFSPLADRKIKELRLSIC
jgi:hypothetical protein